MSLRDHLLALRSEAGSLTPAVVVEAARPKDHPLHDQFEWNDKIAGPRYRLLQAAALIRSVKIDYIRPNGESGTVRQFHVSSTPDGERSYEPIEDIVTNDVAYQTLVRQMQREFRAFKARYEHLAEFADLLRAEAMAS